MSATVLHLPRRPVRTDAVLDAAVTRSEAFVAWTQKPCRRSLIAYVWAHRAMLRAQHRHDRQRVAADMAMFLHNLRLQLEMA